uniref:Uncharacterized protein n=1 Tax=Anguilla anguilla TaxID=7936 RepID=A0A0E9QIA5_ANGAN
MTFIRSEKIEFSQQLETQLKHFTTIKVQLAKEKNKEQNNCR